MNFYWLLKLLLLLVSSEHLVVVGAQNRYLFTFSVPASECNVLLDDVYNVIQQKFPDSERDADITAANNFHDSNNSANNTTSTFKPFPQQEPEEFDTPIDFPFGILSTSDPETDENDSDELSTSGASAKGTRKAVKKLVKHKMVLSRIISASVKFCGAVINLSTDEYNYALSYFKSIIKSSEPDGVSHGSSATTTTTSDPNTPWSCPHQQEGKAPWQLSKTMSDNKTFVPDTFNYNENWGEDVDVYVVDSGVDCTHPDLIGRCTNGFTVYKNGEQYVYDDKHGHGTMVAGVIAGNNVGFARKANIINVRVLNENNQGSTSRIAAAIVWASDRSVETGRKSIINLSLQDDQFSNLTRDSVVAAVEAGVSVIVAAGNRQEDACSKTPSGVRSAIAVGEMTFTQEEGFVEADDSNYGSCVAVWAPGTFVTSTFPQDKSQPPYRQPSGTSFSSSLIAGAAAAFLSLSPPGTTPNDVRNFLVSNTRRGTRDAMNRILNLACADKVPEPPVVPRYPENCWGIVTELELPGNKTQLSLESPGSSNQYYNHDTNNCWRIICAGEITISFLRLEIEEGYDFLYLDDEVLTGDVLPQTSSHANEVSLRFTSDSSIAMKGFVLQATCTPSPCVEVGSPGTLDYPDGPQNYQRQEDICWLFTSCEHGVYLEWIQLDLRQTALLAVETTGNLSDTSFTTQVLYGEGELPPPQTFGTHVRLTFTVDSEKRVGAGFTVQHRCLVEPLPPPPPISTEFPDCFELTSPGVLDFPSGFGLYPNNAQRCWVISCEKEVFLNWRLFELESDDYDRVTIETRDSKHVYGGSSPPPQSSVYPDTVVIRFASDESDAFSGFIVQHSCEVTVEPTPSPQQTSEQTSEQTPEPTSEPTSEPTPGPTFAPEDPCPDVSDKINFILAYVPDHIVCLNFFCPGGLKLVFEPAAKRQEFVVFSNCEGLGLPLDGPALESRPSQIGPLVELRDRLQVSNSSVLRSWGQDNNACNWRGIFCNSEGRVTEINLANEPTATAVLPDLSALDKLENLIVRDTSITGFDGLPDSVVFVNFANTKINGGFPEAVAQLPKLERFLAASCGLAGAFPRLGDSVKQVDVSRNQLEGEIPSPLPTNMTHLNAQLNNRLTGPLPSGNNLVRLEVNGNQLSGNMRRYPNLRFGQFSDNSLAGTLNLATDLPKIEVLHMSHNSIDTVPDFSTAAFLTTFSCTHCKMGGTFTRAVPGQRLLRDLDLSHNELRGPAPTNEELSAIAVNAYVNPNNWDCETQTFSMTTGCGGTTCTHVVDETETNITTGTIESGIEAFYMNMPASNSLPFRCQQGFVWNPLAIGNCPSTSSMQFSEQVCIQLPSPLV